MAFKISKNPAISLESPEELLNDLRQRKIKGLLSYQADVVRGYVNKALSEPDVALQLPTGSGKTLVGLLIGEWRRRKFNERVIYLCPTNQLVHQVKQQAKSKYGLRVNAFTGPKTGYDPNAKSEYLCAEMIAVTSYSGLFNTDPFFQTPHIIILDDAHSAENYISSLWSLRIERKNEDHTSLFAALISALKAILPPTDYQKFTTKSDVPWENTWVDLIPTPIFYKTIPELTSVIDAHTSDSKLKFSWSLIRDHLHACHFYFSTQEILIRPLLPPTNTHKPFADAKQRIYMSATLGEGGELERASGRKKITRLKVPTGWDKQGIGRRLFFFPQRALQDKDVAELDLQMIRESNRALLLFPDDKSVEKARNSIHTHLKFKTFDAREIEKSKELFVSTDQAVAIVANRYDGIDFPEEECRFILIEGLPRATNLQERFLITKLGAGELLNDRILTRIVQAFGRCTRSTNDYAAIVIQGEELTNYLLKPDMRAFLHPELQAELQFGIDQSKSLKKQEFLENLKLFYEQGNEWSEADSDILSIRTGLQQSKLPGTDELKSIVEHEIEYQYAIWQGDFSQALDCCRQILGKLNSSALKSYRALWLYLAGSAAWLSHMNGSKSFEAISRNYFCEAKKASPAVHWLAKLAVEGQKIQDRSEYDPGLLKMIERLEGELERLGTLHDRKFSEEEKFILDNLKNKSSKQFELAHERLGRLLGFDAGNAETDGAPDPWWIVDENLCFVFEDHSDGVESSSLNLTKARQAATHPNWIRENLPLDKNAVILSVLITPVKKAHIDALPHLKDVMLWNVDEFREWGQNALIIIRELRRSFQGAGDIGWRAIAAEKYIEHKMDPKGLKAFLNSRPAKKMLTNKS